MTSPSHRTQQEWWEDEWSKDVQDTVLPGQSDIQPSQVVTDFTEFAAGHFWDKNKALSDISVLDVGCGTGRNSIYLAQRFGKVVGIDYSQQSVALSKRSANSLGIRADFIIGDAISMPFRKGSFDIIVDSFTSTSMQGADTRNRFARECDRLLLSGGLLLMRCVSVEDQTESRLMRNFPGPDVNSSIWPGMNKFQKNFSATEVLEIHSRLGLVSLTRQEKNSFKLGSLVPVTNWVAVFEKPASGENDE